MPYGRTDIVVMCWACVFASGGPGAVHLRPTAVSVSTVAPTPIPRRVGASMSGPTAPSGAIRPAVHERENEMADLQTCILGHWIHSHEEDAPGVTVYRPAHYNFPPSRGRRGFDFRKDGKLVYYGIGRTDGSEQYSGSWVIEGPNLVRINVDGERIQPFVLQVVSCNDQTLKVRR